MNEKIELPMAAPSINEDDVREVVEVLRSGRLALGPKLTAFESAMARYIGVKEAVAVSSGTAALHILVKALELGPGDEVLVPSFTFAASVNAILFVGARPVFVDIESETYNLDPEDLERKITSRTKAIMAVDIFGHPAEWDEILALAEKYGLVVIDDSCEALGAEYKGRKIGGFGDAAAFAFYPNKQMTTGEGGIIVTNDNEIADMARSLRNQGRSEMGAWLEHERLGYNYRMDEMSAALGLSQLRRIERLLDDRKRVARLYTESLRKTGGIRVPLVKEHVKMSWFVYVVTLEKGINRDAVMQSLKNEGIPTRAYFSPIHQQPYIGNILGEQPSLPRTEDVAGRTLALPFHGGMTREDVSMVADSLQRALDNDAG